MIKELEYSPGDLVVLDKILGPTWSGDTNRDHSLAMFHGEIGQIKYLLPNARKYNYMVEFTFISKGGSDYTASFSLMPEELAPVFTK